MRIRFSDLKAHAYGIGLIILLNLCWSSAAEASCGIESCPAYRAVVKQNQILHVNLSTEFVDFALYGTTGQYVQLVPRLEFRGLRNFIFGAQVPVTRLFWNEEVQTGLSNPVVFGEWNWQIDSDVLFLVGIQLELPFGDSELGIADTHVEVLPYLGFVFEIESYFTQIRLGVRQSLDDLMMKDSDTAAHNHSTPIFVNPHTAQEIIYRVNLGRRYLDARLSSSLYLDVISEVGQELESVPVIRTGLDTQWELAENWSLRLRVDRGMSSNRRTETRSDFGLQIRW